MVRIKRAVNGIGINGDEYLLDDAGDVMTFSCYLDAVRFAADKGIVETVSFEKFC